MPITIYVLYHIPKMKKMPEKGETAHPMGVFRRRTGGTPSDEVHSFSSIFSVFTLPRSGRCSAHHHYLPAYQ